MAKKKKSNNLLISLVGIVVLIIIVALVGKSAGWIGQPKELEVEIAEATLATIVERVSASGMVQPEKEVKISPDVSGEITQLEVQEGDSVVQGQLLIKIRPDNYQSALARVQANLNQQKANYTDAQARFTGSQAQFERQQQIFDRNQTLFNEKAISASEFEQVQADYIVAQQNLESARQSVEASRYMVQSASASVNEAQENLSLTNIYAPVNGTISKLSVEQGERVVGTSQMAGTEMLRVADLTQMEVRVDVNENDIIRVSLGDTAIIDVDAYSHLDKEFEGVVTSIANTANEKASPDAVTEFEVRIRILNKSFADLMEGRQRVSPFRPGMTASVDIITNSKQGILAVPLSAVTTRNPNERVGAMGPEDENNQTASEENQNANMPVGETKEVVFTLLDGKAKMVEVTTGISDFDNIEILSGLEEGAQVISGPFLVVSQRLNEGDLVKKMENETMADVASNE